MAVISYGSWQARFGGDPNVVGQQVKIDGLDNTIVGVTPQAFSGAEVISPHGPLTHLCAIALLVMVAFVAGWVAARRALHVDPLTVLSAG